MARLGSKLMHSHGIVHFYAEGTFVVYSGLDEFIRLVGQSDLPSEQLRSLDGALDALFDDGSGLAGAIREDYPLLAAELLEVGNVEMPDDEEFPELLRKFGETVERFAASAYHYNRMQTDLIAQATLALKLYHIEYGTLPETLDELVPDYLDRVPLDDMDGQPIRYDPAGKILYSIGVDLVDNGGSDPELGYDGDDPSWSVDFEPSTETGDSDDAN